MLRGPPSAFIHHDGLVRTTAAEAAAAASSASQREATSQGDPRPRYRARRHRGFPHGAAWRAVRRTVRTHEGHATDDLRGDDGDAFRRASRPLLVCVGWMSFQLPVSQGKTSTNTSYRAYDSILYTNLFGEMHAVRFKRNRNTVSLSYDYVMLFLVPGFRLKPCRQFCNARMV